MTITTSQAYFTNLASYLCNSSTSCFLEGEVKYDSNSCAVLEIDKNIVGDYEEKLRKFLSKSINLDNLVENTVIVVGPLGSGKTTTINTIKNEIILCGKTCRVRESLSYINFNEIQEIDEHGEHIEQDLQIQIERSWSLINEHTKFFDLSGVDSIDYIREFLPWIKNFRGVAINCETLHRFIQSHEFDISALKSDTTPNEQVFKNLDSALKHCVAEKMNSEERCKYQVYMQRWLKEKNKRLNGNCECECMTIIADNIDHLHPEAQRELVHGLNYISDVLRAKSLITVRPATYSATCAGHTLSETYDHCSPSILKVMYQKIKAYNLHLDDRDTYEPFASDTESYFRREVSKSTRRENKALFSRIIEGSCGTSIRHAIRNIHNFFESEIAINAMRNNESPLKVKPSNLAHAYFCSTSRTISSRCFVKLDTTLDGSGWAFSLLKPRILDYLIRITTRKARRVVDIINFLKQFGYKDKVIIDSLNDLIEVHRPLIWSRGGTKINGKSDEAKLEITPIGMGYFQLLFGELTYEQALLEKVEDEEILLSKIVETHHDLTRRAMIELRCFLDNSGPSAYCQVYGKDGDMLAIRHWRNLFAGLRRRKYKNLDWQRENFLRLEVDKAIDFWDKLD